MSTFEVGSNCLKMDAIVQMEPINSYIMKAFAELYSILDTTNNSDRQIQALVNYFRQVPPKDACWALFLLLGHKPRRILSLDRLKSLTFEASKMPHWLFDESLQTVKDVTEACNLLLPTPEEITDIPLHIWCEERFPALRKDMVEEQYSTLITLWKQVDTQQRFVVNKLVTGGFRSPVSESRLIRALAQWRELPETVLAYRLSRPLQQTAQWYRGLLTSNTDDVSMSLPYAFRHTTPLENFCPEKLGDIQHWHVEWKWKGLRAQIVKREGQCFLWSVDGSLITRKFPEIHKTAEALPDGTVLDGIILHARGDAVFDAAELQKRLQRKHMTKALLQDVPVIFSVFDLLELHSNDIRQQPLCQRKEQLVSILLSAPDAFIQRTSSQTFSDVSELNKIYQRAREEGADGLILKHTDTSYEKEERDHRWLAWKNAPFTIRAVLIYVERKQGVGLSPSWEYSFAVRNGERLVLVAKASTGLCESEQQEIEQFAKQHTVERFGPVRSIEPQLVFEVSFAGIRKSTRHKSGVKVDGADIVRWYREKSPEEVDTLAMLLEYVPD